MQLSFSSAKQSNSPGMHRLLWNAVGKSRVVSLVIIAVTVLGMFLFSQNGSEDDPYAATSFCSDDGIGGESPGVASPRTIYSSKSADAEREWIGFHNQLAEKARRYAPAAGKRPLILLGDSITEAWVGTSYGTPSSRAEGIPQILPEFVQALSVPMDPLVLAISGDQTQHLLWRLQNGELVQADNPQAIYVVLIGTNNLGAGELPGPTAQGILAVLDYLVEHTRGQIVALEVLPRADIQRLPPLCPPRCQSIGQPLTSFLPAIDQLNEAVRLKAESMDRVVPAPCYAMFLLEDGTLNSTLFSDQLHPNASGQRILAKCIQQGIETILNGT